MKRYFLAVAMICLLAGCARPGVIVMKVSDNVGHMDMATDDLEPGQKVTAYRDSQPVGQGEVTRIFSEEYSEVSFPEGVVLKEGDTVKLQKEP